MMIGVANLTVLGLGIIVVSLSVGMIQDWDVAGLCPGTVEHCAGVWWTAADDYLRTWLFLGQIMVVLVMASPFALVRV